MGELVGILRSENDQPKGLLASVRLENGELRATPEKAQQEDEALVIRLTTDSRRGQIAVFSSLLPPIGAERSQSPRRERSSMGFSSQSRASPRVDRGAGNTCDHSPWVRRSQHGN